jgi:hypothetical protein
MINYGDIVLGQMYVWLGNETSIFEYTRNGTTPDSLLVTTLTLNYGDIFVALEVIHIKGNVNVFDLKILTAKGYLGYLFRWKAFYFPTKLLLSANDLL